MTRDTRKARSAARLNRNSTDLSATLDQLVRLAAPKHQERPARDEDGEEITIEAEDADSIRRHLLLFAECYFLLATKKERVGRQRKLADFDSTEQNLRSAINEIRAAAKHVDRLNSSLFVKIRYIFAQAQVIEGANPMESVERLPDSLRKYADWIEAGIQEGKDSPFARKPRERAKYLLIVWAGLANYALLSRFLDQFAKSKGIELTKRQEVELGEEALRKFAARHGNVLGQSSKRKKP